MAVPTLGLLNYTLLTAADASTGWTLFTTADADLKKEGANSMSGIFRATLASAYYTNGTPISADGKHIRIWLMTNNLPYMSSVANGGYELLVYDGSTTGYKTLFGSDTYQGGWFNGVVDSSLVTGITLSNATRWGVRCHHDSSAKNAVNTWIDRICYLDGYYLTGGTSGDCITLSTISTADKGTTVLYGYGVVTTIDGVYFCTGKLVIGNGATTTYFKMENDVLVFTDQMVASGLYQITGVGSGCHILINNSTIKSSGTTDNTRFVIDMSDANIASCVITNSVFLRAGNCVFLAGQTITGNTFNGCSQITHGGADMVNCSFSAYEGAADSSSMIYNVATNPKDYIKGCKFTKGTASTHAIQFGINTPITINIENVIFSGYNASNGANDSTLYFSDKGSDTTWTINCSECSGNISYKKERVGDVVNIVIPETVLTLVGLQTGSDISILTASTTTERVNVQENTGTTYPYNYTYSVDDYIDIGVFKVGYIPFYIRNYLLGSTNSNIPISQVMDRAYLE